jgi:hypothetical protein
MLGKKIKYGEQMGVVIGVRESRMPKIFTKTVPNFEVYVPKQLDIEIRLDNGEKKTIRNVQQKEDYDTRQQRLADNYLADEAVAEYDALNKEQSDAK